jgi:ferredoxin
MSHSDPAPGVEADTMPFTVRFEPGGDVFTVHRDEPLLHAAEQAGISLPSSCRNGTCRTCMCQLQSGEVRYHIQWPGLMPEEKAEGWILPCIARAQSDLVLSRPSRR